MLLIDSRKEADVVLLPMTRANKRGSLGFMTVLNRINVATSRARHRLILIGNARQLEEMGAKYDAKILTKIQNQV